MKIRRATPEDSIQVLMLGLEFLQESNFNNPDVYTVDLDRAAFTAKHVCAGGDNVTFVAVDDLGYIHGFITASFERYWTVEPVTQMFLFYIRPRHRDSKTANELLDCWIAEGKARRAGGFYAGSTAGFSDGGVNARAFSLLLKRKGFKVIGDFLYMEL